MSQAYFMLAVVFFLAGNPVLAVVFFLLAVAEVDG